MSFSPNTNANHTYDSLEEMIKALHAVGNQKKVRGLTVHFSNEAGDVASVTLGDDETYTGWSAVELIATAVGTMAKAKNNVHSVTYTMDCVVIINNDLDTVEESYNVTGNDPRSIEKLMRGIAINMNQNGYYLSTAIDTYNWVA